jgi:hypothetical protein
MTVRWPVGGYPGKGTKPPPRPKGTGAGVNPQARDEFARLKRIEAAARGFVDVLDELAPNLRDGALLRELRSALDE